MDSFFSTYYESLWQHPLALWLSALVGLTLALRRADVAPSVRGWAVGLTALSLLDAWLTTTYIPGLGRLSGVWASVVPLSFVILGDLRYLLLRAWASSDGEVRLELSSGVKMLALAFVVPVISQLLFKMSGDESPRVLFLIYEVSFIGLIMSLQKISPPSHPWARRLDQVALAWYLCWSLSDLMILVGGMDLGFALRSVANLLYYGALPLVLVRSAPAGSSAT